MFTLQRLAAGLKKRIRNTIICFQRRIKIKRSTRCIFIDCGANTCSILRKFIKRFPDFEFFAFEPQPELADEGRKIKAEYPDVPISFFSTAVWTSNEKKNLFLATYWTHNYKGGSTLLEEHTGNLSKVDYSYPIEVTAIDFSEWLALNFSSSDYVIIKMDIEGAEYDVLEKIISDGNQSIINELIVEFHQRMNQSISLQRHDKLIKELKKFSYLRIWH